MGAGPLESWVEEACVGWLWMEGGRNGPSPKEVVEEMDRVARQAIENAGTPEAETRRAAVRDLLRHGRYRPTGRGKPASEYLLRTAIEGGLPRINLLADLNNLVSLRFLLPISMVDIDRASEERFRVRRGGPGEHFVFNPSGQVLDLEDLLLVATASGNRPIATPVKDCQATKTDAETRRALAVLYGPRSLAEVVREATEVLASGMMRHAGGEVRWGLL